MGVIRFLLAVAVILAHSRQSGSFRMTGGPISVQTFFIISGFYMALVLNEKYLPGASSYGLFFRNRLLRLFPSYWLLLIPAIAVRFLAGSNPWVEWRHVMSPASAAFLVSTNLALFGQDLTLFLGFDTVHGTLHFVRSLPSAEFPAERFLFIPQAWSLGVELLFYTVAPFLVRRRVSALLLIVAASLLLRILLYFGAGLTDDPWTYRFFPTELALFLTGSIAYSLYRRLRESGTDVRRIAPACWALTVASILLYDRVNFPGKPFVYFPCVAVAIPVIFLWTKSMSWDRLVGELSYPMYICHLLVIGLFHRLHRDSLVLVIPATVAVAIAVTFLVDQPIDQIRQRYASRRRAKPAVAPPESVATP